MQEKRRSIDVNPAAVDVVVRTLAGQQEAVTAAGQRPFYGYSTGCLIITGLGARHPEPRLLQANISPQKQFVVEFIPCIEPTGLQGRLTIFRCRLTCTSLYHSRDRGRQITTLTKVGQGTADILRQFRPRPPVNLGS